MSIEDQIHGVLIAADQAAAAALFNGQNDITISSRCGMALLDRQHGLYDPSGPHGIEAWALVALAEGLNELERDHCMLAILADRDRAAKVLLALTPYVAAIQIAAVKSLAIGSAA